MLTAVGAGEHAQVAPLETHGQYLELASETMLLRALQTQMR